jgi:hypothetical protein
MLCTLRRSIGPFAFFALTLLIVLPRTGAADDHVVKPADLQKALEDSARTRRDNLEALARVVSSETGARTLKTAGLDSHKVEQALALLGDSELAALAERARTVESDFEGGSLTNQQITYILIALATAVIILVLVAAR